MKVNHVGLVDNDRYFIQSLAKGLALLRLISTAEHSLSLTEIAARLDTNKATATRFCYTLVKLGYLHRTDQKLYDLTPKVLELGYSAICRTDWHEMATYFLRELFSQLDETVSAAILVETDILYTIRIIKKKILDMDIQVGSRLPVHCTAMGKVLLAFSPPEGVQDVLRRMEFKKMNEKTITSPQRFLKELERVRQMGYAISDEEVALGNRSIGAPLLGDNGNAFAAIAVATPSGSYSIERLKKEVAPPLLACAQKISTAMKQIWQKTDMVEGTPAA
jgi:IclR family transcriptional regulator, pca regulon regulatory protein